MRRHPGEPLSSLAPVIAIVPPVSSRDLSIGTVPVYSLSSDRVDPNPVRSRQAIAEQYEMLTGSVCMPPHIADPKSGATLATWPAFPPHGGEPHSQAYVARTTIGYPNPPHQHVVVSGDMATHRGFPPWHCFPMR
jgi:hypothetical protein